MNGGFGTTTPEVLVFCGGTSGPLGVRGRLSRSPLFYLFYIVRSHIGFSGIQKRIPCHQEILEKYMKLRVPF